MVGEAGARHAVPVCGIGLEKCGVQALPSEWVSESVGVWLLGSTTGTQVPYSAQSYSQWASVGDRFAQPCDRA